MERLLNFVKFGAYFLMISFIWEKPVLDTYIYRYL